MKTKLEEILKRRGALHIINDTSFYTKSSVLAAMQEAAYSLGLKERSGYELYGYLFEGKFYGDLEMLRNKTMSESNKPLPLFVKTDSEERDKEWINIENKLPDFSVNVLVMYSQTTPQMSGRLQYAIDRRTELVKGNSVPNSMRNRLEENKGFLNRVIFWQPLPKAPNL